jgi:hypothetical protein
MEKDDYVVERNEGRRREGDGGDAQGKREGGRQRGKRRAQEGMVGEEEGGWKRNGGEECPGERRLA